MADPRKEQHGEAVTNMVISTIQSSTTFGAGAGVLGGLLAGTFGVLEGIPRPGLRIVSASITYFLWGSAFWGLRTAGLEVSNTLRGREHVSSSDRLFWTSAAGAISGCSSGLMRRHWSGGQRGLVVSTTGIWGLAALGAQGGLELYQSRRQRRLAEEQLNPREKLPILHRIAASKWSPFKLLSDEEHQHHIEEQILRVEAEIALVDDQIAALKLTASEDVAAENPEP